MGNLWLKIKVWTKIVIFVALVVYVIIFAWENGNQSIHIWYWFNHAPEINLLWLVLFTLLAGIVGTLLVRTVMRTVSQLRELSARNRAAQRERDVTTLQNKVAMLQTKVTAPTTAPATPTQRPLP